MIIVHITSLSNNRASGIANIVPSYIKWQSKFANVCWYNLSLEYIPPTDMKNLYFGVKDIPKNNIRFLPEPFSKPDLVIFHGIFFYKYCEIARQLNKLGIQYIVVPHGSLTVSSIKQKAIKKYIGFMILFKKFLKGAKAIQYLTEGEHRLSGDKWNNSYIIVPNGCEIPKRKKKEFRNHHLKGVFIGRKSIYYKGLDLLIEACNIVKNQLENTNCTIYIYGPDEDGGNEKLSSLIKKYSLENYIKLYNSLYNEKKEEILLDSDFFILTSRTEGHPVALIEALSYGIPCFITTGTNMSKEISDYDAGWFSEIDIDKIANTLSQILNNTDQLYLKGENAYSLSLNYEWSRVAEKTIKIYAEI